jgi:hypothetical protein
MGISVDPAEIFARKPAGLGMSAIEIRRATDRSPRRQANDTAAIGSADRGRRRSAGSYSVAYFVGILGKAGGRRAMGYLVDHPNVCVLEQASHPSGRFRFCGTARFHTATSSSQ